MEDEDADGARISTPSVTGYKSSDTSSESDRFTDWRSAEQSTREYVSSGEWAIAIVCCSKREKAAIAEALMAAVETTARALSSGTYNYIWSTPCQQ